MKYIKKMIIIFLITVTTTTNIFANEISSQNLNNFFNVQIFEDSKLGLTVKTYEDKNFHYQETIDVEFWVISKISKNDGIITIIDTNLDITSIEFILDVYSKTSPVLENEKFNSMTSLEITPYTINPDVWTLNSTYTGSTKIKNQAYAAILAALSGLIAFANGYAGIVAGAISAFITQGFETMYYRAYKYTKWKPCFMVKTNAYFYTNAAMTNFKYSTSNIKEFCDD